MKQMNTLSMGLTFAGCFLGAGYISGQEIWQYFGCFGAAGIAGCLLAMALMGIFGLLLMDLTRRTGIEAPDKIVIPWPLKVPRAVVGALQVFFMFGVCVIMYAGAGALIEQVLGIPHYIGSAALCLLVAAVSLRGFSGVVESFSLLVPCLVVMTVGFSAFALCRWGFGDFTVSGGINPLLGDWKFSSLNYVSYSIFCSIGVLCPLTGQCRDGRTAAKGVALGSLLLFLIAFAILCALYSHPESTAAQLPMLSLAMSLSSLGVVYALLMLMGMFGAALSCHVATAHYLLGSFPLLAGHGKTAAFTLILLGWLGSLMGFGDLVGTVYPLCGYCGFAAMALICIHYIKVRWAR